MTPSLDANPALTIRLAKEADIPALIDLDQQSSTAAHWSEAQYRTFFSGQQRLILVGELTGNEAPIGFLVAHQIGVEWELENIVVAPERQVKGFGSQLLAALVSKARDSNGKAVFLEVRASNAAARALYKKATFQQTGLRKSYYHNPLEDAVLYRLDLD